MTSIPAISSASPDPIIAPAPAPPLRRHSVKVVKQSTNANPTASSPFTFPAAVAPITKSFAKLAAGDDDSEDSEDDVALSESLSIALGKRDRMSSPMRTEDSSRPARRLACRFHLLSWNYLANGSHLEGCRNSQA